MYDYYVKEHFAIGDNVYEIGDRIRDEDVGLIEQNADWLKNKVVRVNRDTP